MSVAAEAEALPGLALAPIGRRLVRFLTQPIPGFLPLATADPEAFRRTLRRGDVVLVEGNTRIATAIKYLTQSTWSHAALYVGPIPGRGESDGEPHALIEADAEHGVVSVPVSKYAASHTRICRPVGLSEGETQKVADFALARIGLSYDLKNIADLLRYLLPTPPVPSRWRRRMIALGAGSPTRAICSTLIAQAFQSVHYPILPSPESIEHAMRVLSSAQSGDAARYRLDEIRHIRHYSLFTPRDFDISPYFAIVKPTIEIGFDYKKVDWARLDADPPALNPPSP
ncbi:MAG: lipo-like protein [Rhizobiales bacterium 65-9]|nr:lipo-like protein [Hyphomicrobiales bacterium]OJY35410.1 MAG: lipo-like protein [Rhizobiales bacterium 65-9]